jgi:hypothetical protein
MDARRLRPQKRIAGPGKSLKGKDGSSYKDSNALKSMKLIVILRRALASSSD